MQAYILINCEPAKLWNIAEEAITLKGVKQAHAVTGQFDVVIYAEFPDMNSFRDLIVTIQSMEGIERTQTAVSIPPRIK